MSERKKPDLSPGSLVTIGDKYGHALAITDQSEADAYFEECVAHCMSFGKSRDDAIAVEKANIGYYAGYYSSEARARAERLFRCAHPVFGAIAERGEPTAEEAFAAGVAAAKGSP